MSMQTPMVLAETRESGAQLWRWFVAAGAVLATLGVIASVDLVTAARVTLAVAGLILTVFGVFEIWRAWRADVRHPIWSRLAIGLVSIGGGFGILSNPLPAAVLMALLIGVALAMAGAARIAFAFRYFPRRWGWLLVSGLVSAALAGAIAIALPRGAIWILGLILAFDLLLQGVMLIVVGFAIKAIGR